MNAAEILAGGARLVRTQPKAVAIWGLLYLVVMAVMLAVFAPMFRDLLAFQAQAMAAQAAHTDPLMPSSGFFVAIFGINIVILLVGVVIFAAAVRATAQGGADSFAFLRIGADEARLIGLSVLLLLICIGLYLVSVLVGALLIAVVAAVSSALAVVLGVVLFIALVAALIWAEVRISLAGVLTVLRGRIVIREAWRMTQGRFWTLFGTYLLLMIVLFAISFTVMMIANPDMLSVYGAGMQPADVEAAMARQQAALADTFGPRWIVTTLISSLINGVIVAFMFGAMTTATIGFDRADYAA